MSIWRQWFTSYPHRLKGGNVYGQRTTSDSQSGKHRSRQQMQWRKRATVINQRHIAGKTDHHHHQVTDHMINQPLADTPRGTSLRWAALFSNCSVPSIYTLSLSLSSRHWHPPFLFTSSSYFDEPSLVLSGTFTFPLRIHHAKTITRKTRSLPLAHRVQQIHRKITFTQA